MTQPALNGGFVKEAAVVITVDEELLVDLHGIEDQFKGHRLPGQRIELARHRPKRRQFQRPIQVEDRLDQCGSVFGLARMQCLQQPGKRIELMLVAIKQAAARLG